MSLEAGQRLGSYEIIAPLGAGGMGEVYRARDSKLKREVAIKVLPDDVANDRERLARFQREAEVLASLNHPHIAHVYGIEGNALVMELVEGEDLSQRIARGAIPLDEAMPIARQIAEALEAAHDHGIIHRDLKPANIKVRDDGTVKVLDFGLAKAAETVSSQSSALNSPTITTPAMTMHGVILGTAAYMSPEQAKGKAVDRRADIWAFGCVLYEMLTGQRTFTGEDVSDTLVSVLRDDPRWAALPSTTPPQIRQLLKRCLQRDPQKRLPHIGVARLELADTTTPEDVTPPRQRSSFLLAGAGTIAGAVVTAAILIWLRPTAVESSRPIQFAITPPPGGSFTGGNGVPRFAVSADGNHIVYQLSNGKTTALWFRSLDSTQARMIPGTETEVSGNAIQQAFWSPDARSIAYFDEATHQLKRVDREFGSVQLLASLPGNQYGGSWSDEDVIVMSSLGTNGIQRVAASGGTITQVTKVDAGQREASHLWPQFFPDGRHFVYLTSYLDGAPSALFLASLDGGAPRRLTPSPAGGHPDGGGYLVYLREGATVAQHVDLERGSLTGEPVVIGAAASRTPVGRAAISVSRSNVLVYASNIAEILPLASRWVDRSGHDLPSSPKPVLTGVRALRLSPDDSVLAYLRRATMQGGQPNVGVWLQDVGRGIETKLADVPALVGVSLVFSPDSSRFITRTFDNQHFTFFHQPVSGATPPLAFATADQNEPLIPYDWTPDGRGVLMTRGDAQSGGPLWTFPIDPRDKPVRYEAGAAVRFGAALSPDGHWVAYTAGSLRGGGQIFLQPYPDPTGGKWPVSGIGASYPRWSRDGRELFFQQDLRLMAVSITTSPRVEIGSPHELFSLSRTIFVAGASDSAYSYDVMHRRDGFVILESTATGDGSSVSLTVMTDWLSALEAKKDRTSSR